MPLNFQSPMTGGPATKQTRDAQGRPVFTIKVRALTPMRARIVDTICDVGKFALWLILVVMTALLYSKNRLTPEGFVALAAGLAAVYYVVRQVLRCVFVKRTSIRMTVDAISVRGWLGWKHFSRAFRRSFIVLPHDLVQWEHETNDLKRRKAAQRGRVIQPRSYYGYSVHVALVYAGHRVDLVDVFDARRATPIAQRLQYCDEVLYTFEGKSRGPRDDEPWGAAAPGGL